MSVLVVGVSHHSAPYSLLEQVTLDGDAAAKLVGDVLTSSHVNEAAVISTCNRLEVYADVDRFHGGVEEVSRLLGERAGVAADDLVKHLFVHYDDAAVAHLFEVTAGLDSMAIGEAQILGQTREALRRGQEQGSIGPALNVLFQQALRVGKRAHAETGIDGVAPTLVGAGLAQAEPSGIDLAGARAVVVGAGSMAGLAVATLRREGVGDVRILNRTGAKAARLAAEHDVSWRPLTELGDVLADADVVVSCTGSAGIVVSEPLVRAARVGRDRPVLLVDLALPHDIDPSVRDVPGVSLVRLADLGERLSGGVVGAEVEAVRDIVVEEVAAFLAARRQASVTPTVVALRTMATGVVDSEMARLDARLPDLDPTARAEVLRTVHRVAEKLLHQPTVRVRELAEETGAVSYAAALAELFALDPEAVSAVTRPGAVSDPVEGGPR